MFGAEFGAWSGVNGRGEEEEEDEAEKRERASAGGGVAAGRLEK